LIENNGVLSKQKDHTSFISAVRSTENTELSQNVDALRTLKNKRIRITSTTKKQKLGHTFGQTGQTLFSLTAWSTEQKSFNATRMTDKECFQQHIYQNKLKLAKKRDLNRVAWRFKNFFKQFERERTEW